MKRKIIELIEIFRIAFGLVFALFAGYVLKDDLVLSFLLLLVGVGFASFRITYEEEKEIEEE